MSLSIAQFGGDTKTQSFPCVRYEGCASHYKNHWLASSGGSVDVMLHVGRELC